MATTQNLHLPQFEGSDRIHHDDFNEAFEKIDTAVAAAGNCRIATGSYIGTGKCGNNHPNTLTFDFPPQIVIIKRKAHGTMPTVLLCADTCAQSYISPTSGGQLAVSANGSSISWFHDGGNWTGTSSGSSAPDSARQLNDTVEYVYFAIG